MANLILPASGSIFSEDTVFQVDCAGGGGTAIVGRSLGDDQGGYGGAGVAGSSEDGGAGVIGTSSGVDRDGNGGGGVLGTADSGGYGVRGESSGLSAPTVSPDVESPSPGIGVSGLCADGVGVQGESVNGTGVIGMSVSGVGLYARGNKAAAILDGYVRLGGDASQALAGGGCVKALLHLSSGAVKRFFSSQPDAPAPTCYRLDRGIYSIDFHFQINDRYVTVTPIAGDYKTDQGVNPGNPFAPFWWPPSSGSVFESKFFVANIVFDGLTEPPSSDTPPPGQRQLATTMVTVMTFQPTFQKTPGGLSFQGFQLVDCDVSVAVL